MTKNLINLIRELNFLTLLKKKLRFCFFFFLLTVLALTSLALYEELYPDPLVANFFLTSISNRTYSTDRITPDPVRLNHLAERIQEQSDVIIVIELPDGEQQVLSKEFIEWFRGFVDAEGCFLVPRRGNGFGFRFDIKVHMDDKQVLNYISQTLGIGNVYAYNKTFSAVFTVMSRAELLIILCIFSKYNLNSTKHLNFLAFAQAFLLYDQNTNRKYRNEIKSLINDLIDNLNMKRSNFDLPISHKFDITPSWLLGFVEGEGSFFYNKQDGRLFFTIGQKGNKALMEAIADFLQSLSTDQGTNNASVKVVPHGVKDTWVLRVSQLAFIEFVLIPFFNSRVFRSKKYLDYLDWVAILNIRKKGLHYLPEGKELIARILAQMNQNRLTNNPVNCESGKSEVTRDERSELLSEITNLLSLPSNYESRENGKIWIISEKRYFIEVGKVKAVSLHSTDGTLNKTFENHLECANFLGVTRETVSRRIKKSLHFQFENKSCYLK